MISAPKAKNEEILVTRICYRHLLRGDFFVNGETECDNVFVDIRHVNSTIIHNYCEDNKDFKVIEYRGEREARYYKDYYPVELNMVLFKGMYVTFVDNGENYSKGSLAKIIRINEETVTVIMLNNETTLKIKRKLFASNEKNIKPIEQYPFKPAFAITVHSAQGQTFNRAYVHTDMFAKKQFYVAVSRVRTLEGLTIVGDITKQIFGKEAVWPIICDE